MIKNTVIALVAAVSFAGVAVPAFAAPAPVASTDSVFGSGTAEFREISANSVLTQLQQRGINATGVEEWSGLIRAFVTLEDGSQVMKFYQPGSLVEVTL